MCETLDELLYFIPLFERETFRSAESVYLSTGEYLPEMERLLEAANRCEIKLNDFDWLAWSPEATEYMREPERIKEADADTLRKLLTVLAESNRFNRALFPHLCAKGFVSELLHRLRAVSA